MAYRFSACGYALGFDEPDATFRTMHRAGFAGIEANDGVVDGREPDAISALGRRAAELGIPFTSYHLPFAKQHDVASFYETERLEAVRLIAEAMHRAAQLGARTLILHPSTSSYDTKVEGDERYRDRLCRSLEVIVPVAEKLDARIAVENMMHPQRDCYFSRPEHIERFRERFDHERVGFCLDTGHAIISAGPSRQLEIMEAMRGKLFAFHLQDNPGDRDLHIAPGRGNVDFAGIVARIRADSIDEVMCIETAPFDGVRPYTPSAWRGLVDDTATLFERDSETREPRHG